MLPLYFVKRTMDRRGLNRLCRNHHDEMNTSILYSADNTLFSVQQVACVDVPGERSDIHFEVTCEGVNHEQTLFLALIEAESPSISDSCPGLVVSISLGDGEVKDLANDQGVIGYFDGAPFERGQPLPISVDLDVIGKVCIPKITIGGESLLHPAMQLQRRDRLGALVGHTLTSVGSITFENAALNLSRSAEKTLS